MNVIEKKGMLCELACGDDFAYVLNEKDIFSFTEYKVLQSQSEGIFVRCVKALFNGDIQLYYLLDGYKSLDMIVHSIDSKVFINLMKNLLDGIIAVKNNGFLSCQNIDISLRHIFFDVSTYKIGLVYLPITQRLFVDTLSFENTLRTNLIELIKNTPSLSSPQILQIVSDLSNETISLEVLLNKVKGLAFVNDDYMIDSEKKNMVMKLISINSSYPIEILVSKNDFTIGKKQGFVDGFIPNNKMISRTHCKIVRQDGLFSVVDMDSVNGTYVNGERIESGVSLEIKNGDVLRLANSEFKVIIE